MNLYSDCRSLFPWLPVCVSVCLSLSLSVCLSLTPSVFLNFGASRPHKMDNSISRSRIFYIFYAFTWMKVDWVDCRFRLSIPAWLEYYEPIFWLSTTFSLAACLYLCVFLSIPVCLSVSNSFCLSVRLSLSISMFLHLCLSVSHSFYLPVCLCLSVCLCSSIYLSIHQSIYL